MASGSGVCEEDEDLVRRPSKLLKDRYLREEKERKKKKPENKKEGIGRGK